MVGMNKFKFFTIGLVILFIGIQFRLVESITLTPSANERVARLHSPDKVERVDNAKKIIPVVDIPRKPITPPEWFGWMMITCGSVSFFHALMLPKDG